MRVVFDTNVYLSAVIHKGVPEQALDYAVLYYELVGSSFVYEEIRRTLSSKKFSWSLEDIEDALFPYKRFTVFIEPATVEPLVRDAKDDPVLACALASEAKWLVTGDKDLLVLKRFDRLRIVTPRQFLDAA